MNKHAFAQYSPIEIMKTDDNEEGRKVMKDERK